MYNSEAWNPIVVVATRQGAIEVPVGLTTHWMDKGGAKICSGDPITFTTYKVNDHRIVDVNLDNIPSPVSTEP